MKSMQEGEAKMTASEWEIDFKSFIGELQMPRDDYKGIMAYIEDGAKLMKAQEEEIKQLKAMNISASDNAFACGVIHGGVTINQKASEITNIKHVDVFNG